MNKTLKLLILIATIQGCTFQRLAISHGEYLLKRQIKSYIDFNDQQEQNIDILVSNIWNGIKSSESKTTISKLEVLLGNSPLILDNQKYDDLTTVFQSQFSKIIKENEDLIHKILVSLSESQIKQLEENFSKKRKEQYESMQLKEDEFLEVNRERQIDSFERWYGEANKKQTIIISNYVLSKQLYSDMMLSRESAQNNFIKFLKKRPEKTELSKTLVLWIQNPNLMRDDSIQSSYFKVRNHFKKQAIEFNKLATDEQRTYAHKKIKVIITDVKEALEI